MSQQNANLGCGTYIFLGIIIFGAYLIGQSERNQQLPQAPPNSSSTIVIPQPQIPNMFQSPNYQVPGFAQQWMQPKQQVRCWREYNQLARQVEVVCE